VLRTGPRQVTPCGFLAASDARWAPRPQVKQYGRSGLVSRRFILRVLGAGEEATDYPVLVPPQAPSPQPRAASPLAHVSTLPLKLLRHHELGTKGRRSSA